jgi:hypothetical protein
MNTVFLFGAGFSAVGNQYYEKPPHKRYPLAADLAAECFETSANLGQGVEEAFAQVIKDRNKDPIKKLCNVIQTADHFLGAKAAADSSSVFRRLIQRFPQANRYLTFNYDCLLELVLFREKRWIPTDGFGIPVEVSLAHLRDGSSVLQQTSKVQVLHLHGSFCYYAVEFSTVPDKNNPNIGWLQFKAPRFIFNADILVPRFFPYQKGGLDLGYRPPWERIIAPVPDKAEELENAYVQEIYRRAEEALSSADVLIAIGYSFARTDNSSYNRLLKTLSQRQGQVVVVCPIARDIVERLSTEHPRCLWHPLELTLEAWANQGFPLPGLASRQI